MFKFQPSTFVTCGIKLQSADAICIFHTCQHYSQSQNYFYLPSHSFSVLLSCFEDMWRWMLFGDLLSPCWWWFQHDWFSVYLILNLAQFLYSDELGKLKKQQGWPHSRVDSHLGILSDKQAGRRLYPWSWQSLRILLLLVHRESPRFMAQSTPVVNFWDHYLDVR